MTLRESVCNRLVIFAFCMFFVMVRHLPDEYSREEHKDEGLEERHEQLKEADWNRGDNRDQGNRPGSKPALRAGVGSRANPARTAINVWPATMFAKRRIARATGLMKRRAIRWAT